MAECTHIIWNILVETITIYIQFKMSSHLVHKRQELAVALNTEDQLFTQAICSSCISIPII